MEKFDRSIMALWAKKEEKESRFYWLPLMIHLEDTMNVSRWLWNNWISDSQRKFCLSSMNIHDEETAVNLAAFLGAVHDIGKATPAFQIQKGYRNSPDLDKTLLEKLERVGYDGISTVKLTASHKSHHSLAGEYLLKEVFHVKDDISSIIGGHHGKPTDDLLIVNNQVAYAENYFQSADAESCIYKRWQHVQQEIFQWALKKSGFCSVSELPEISRPAQVVYSGILIMADWVASNSAYFPLIDIDTEYVSESKTRVQNGVFAWCGDMPLQIQNYPPMNDLFIHRFGFEPRDFQKTVYQTVGQIEDPGIIILEAPMGLGKTEAALASAEEVAAKNGSSGLFFGLPTQATSNGMFDRVYMWLKNLTAEYGAKQSLRLCHGKAALNEDMNSLRNASSTMDINVDEEDNGSVFVNEWFSGRKKVALDDFVVGTVDGFLLTALKQKHLALRHLGFSKKVIIIDEVHAYDTYMMQYLKEAIRWMGVYGVSVILASATLPRNKRKELIEVYLRGKGVKGRDMKFPEEITSGNCYPIISYTDGTEIKVQTDFVRSKDNVVYVRYLDEEKTSEKLSELLEGGGVIGVIVNTVRKAQKLGRKCKALFGEDTVEILHSAFIATDRVSKESALMKMIGKGGKRPEKKIIIGTQVIEQSLDIDFDVLITDLCPMDLLLQRIGRLHRHDIPRPEKHRQAVVYVTGTDGQMNFDKGSVMVYGKYYLIRTQYYLPQKIRIPSDISVLVNKVYGDEVPEFQGELQNVYQESRNKMKILQKKKEDKALTYCIDDPVSKINPERYNLRGWLANPDHSESEETAAAQVRDINETIEVIAVKKICRGYGIFGSKEDISGRIDDPRVAKELAKHTIRLPGFVTINNGVSQTIDYLEKYNRIYLSEWQNQPWLKGALGIIFDENGNFDLNGIHLEYDSEYGLREGEKDGEL